MLQSDRQTVLSQIIAQLWLQHVVAYILDMKSNNGGGGADSSNKMKNDDDRSLNIDNENEDDNQGNSNNQILTQLTNALLSSPENTCSNGSLSNTIQEGLDSSSIDILSLIDMVENTNLYKDRCPDEKETSWREQNVSTQKDKIFLLEQIKAGNVTVDEYYLDKPNELLASYEITSDMQVPLGEDKSSWLPGILSTSAFTTNGVQGEVCVINGHDVTHNHTAPLRVGRDPLNGMYSATPVDSVDEAITVPFEPHKSFARADFTQWYTNPLIRAWRLANGVLEMWNNATQNYNTWPNLRLRQSKGYISGHWKMDRCWNWLTFAQRLGIVRWIQRYHNTYWYGHGASGRQYLQWYKDLYMSYSILPGNFLHPIYTILQAHFFDKTRWYPDIAPAGMPLSWNWLFHYNINLPVNPANVTNRIGSLMNQITRDRAQFRANVPPLGAIEEGEFNYFNADFIDGLVGYLCKMDRYLYNNPFLGNCQEWTSGATLQVVRNQELTQNIWTGFDENLNGMAQIIRTKYPQPSFATFHVIFGKTKETVLSGMEFIQYWNFFRPVLRPKLYRLVIKKPMATKGMGNLKDDSSSL